MTSVPTETVLVTLTRTLRSLNYLWENVETFLKQHQVPQNSGLIESARAAVAKFQDDNFVIDWRKSDLKPLECINSRSKSKSTLLNLTPNPYVTP